MLFSAPGGIELLNLMKASRVFWLGLLFGAEIESAWVVCLRAESRSHGLCGCQDSLSYDYHEYQEKKIVV